MIIKFFNRVLESLEAIYGFEGATSRIDRLDMGPVSLVHDVSRQSEAAQGFPFQVVVLLTTDGAGTQAFGATTLTPGSVDADKMRSRNLDASELEVWLLGVTLDLANADSNLNVALGAAGVLKNDGQGTFVVLCQWGADCEFVLPVNAAGRRYLAPWSGNLGTFRAGEPVFRPMKIEPGDQAIATAQDDGVAALSSASFRFWCWASPRGSFPPGT